MSGTDRLVLIQLLEQCDRIEERICRFEISEERFLDESAFFDMLLMPLFQIGELAGALSEDFRVVHREIPWHAVVGFRNVIARDCGVVDPLWVWNTIQHDIPVLRAFLIGEIGI